MKCVVFVVIVFICLCHTEWGGTYDSCSITSKAMASTAPSDSTSTAATPRDTHPPPLQTDTLQPPGGSQLVKPPW